VSRTGELPGVVPGRTAPVRPEPSLVLTDARVDVVPAALDTAAGTAGARPGSDPRPSTVRGLLARPGSVSTDDRK
jgi:hypothetical protein